MSGRKRIFPQSRAQRQLARETASSETNIASIEFERRFKLILITESDLSLKLWSRRLPTGVSAIYFQDNLADEPVIVARRIEDLPQVQGGGSWYKSGGTPIGDDESSNFEYRFRIDAEGAPVLDAEFYRVGQTPWRVIFVRDSVDKQGDSFMADLEPITSSAIEGEGLHDPHFSTFSAGTELLPKSPPQIFGDMEVRNIMVGGILRVLSDESSKTDIQRVDSFIGLFDRFMRIDTATFKDINGQTRLGLLAQNLFEVFPDAVQDALVNNRVLKTIDMTAVTAIMIATIKDLISTVTYLKESIALKRLGYYNDDWEQVDVSDGKILVAKSTMSVDQAAAEICKDLMEPNFESVHILLVKHGVNLGLDVKNDVVANPPENGKSLGGAWFKLMKSALASGTGEALIGLSSESVRDQMRSYQTEAVDAIGADDSILVLPTGFGKTLVSIKVMESTLERFPDSSAIFVCQQRSLAGQQPEFLYRDGPAEWREKGAILLYYGGGVIQAVDGVKKTLMNWKSASGRSESLNNANFPVVMSTCKILVVTAGALKDLLMNEKGNFDFKRISIVVLDESHHAGEGDHPMVFVARYFSMHSQAQLLGLTASPVSGSTDPATLEMKLRQLMSNMRNAKMVVPKVENSIVDPQPARVDLTEKEVNVMQELCALAEHLEAECFADTDHPQKESYGSKYLEWAYNEEVKSRAKGNVHRAALCHALKAVVETVLLCRDIGPICAKSLMSSLVDMEKEFAGADGVLNFLTQRIMHGIFREAGLSSPAFVATKLTVLERILRERDSSSKTLIRVATKRGVIWLTNHLYLRRFNVGSMLGRADMTDSSSKMALEQFKQGQVDILVTTSVVEEGIDLQSCDLVIAYSVKGIIVSGKALIQNAGRARMANSRIIVLVADQLEERELEAKREQIRQMKLVLRRIRDG